MADGSITFSVDIDNKKALAELNKVEGKIGDLKKELEKKTAERSGIVQTLDEARKAAIDAENEVDRLQKALSKSKEITSVEGERVSPQIYTQELENQELLSAELSQQIKLRDEANKAAEKAEAADRKAVEAIQKVTDSLDAQKTRAGELTQEITASGSASARMAQKMDEVNQRMEKLTNRLKGLARRVFVFTLITTALRGLRTWLWNSIKANDQASAAIAKLKGALLTLAQPLVNVIIPAFTALVSVLAKVVSIAAQIMSMLFGQTIQSSKEAAENLYNETAALNSTGSAAKKAAKSLANFDEINQLSDNSSSAGGEQTIKPDFDLGESLSEDRLKNILRLVEFIGSALAAWKISSALGLGLKGFVGVLAAVYSGLQFVQNMLDAWANGASWSNLQGMLASLAGVALGLFVAFGKVASGISLVVGGIATLVTGFKDAFTNGWSFENLLTTISGLLMGGLGIGVLTGTFFPVLIAGIASVLLAFTVATGHGEELLAGLRTMLEGFKEFFVGVFTGDIEGAIEGVNKIVDGFGGVVQAVISGVKDTIWNFLDWLDQKTGGKLHGIIEFVKGLFNGLLTFISSVMGGMLAAVKQILNGVITFISGVFSGDWEKAWGGIKNIFKGIVNGIISIFEGMINLIVRGLNWFIRQLNKISFDIPEWVPLIGGKRFGFNIPMIGEAQLPRLAQGAVIPPNREFLAVLGDQKQGTNIETPLSTMVEAFKQAMAESGGGGSNRPVYLMLDRRELGRAVLEVGDQERVRVGVSLT